MQVFRQRNTAIYSIIYKTVHASTIYPLATMPADTLSLAGKIAIVTGSGRENGIGAAIARALARNGAAVAIHYSSASSQGRAEKVASSIRMEFGVATTVIEGAVENRETAREMVKRARSGLNAERIDILGAQSHWTTRLGCGCAC